MVVTAKHKRTLGRAGEKLAKRFLKKQGYRHLTSNYATGQGEIDLIMQEGETIVFVEVKTRADENFAPPEMAVNYGKRKRISAAAQHFIRTHNAYDMPCRFDVVAVITKDKGKPNIRHQKNAFRI